MHGNHSHYYHVHVELIFKALFEINRYAMLSKINHMLIIKIYGSKSKSHIHFLSLRSFIQGIRPGLRLLVVFHNKLIFYGEELLAPCPTHKLEDHPLSAVRDCLFGIFAATLQNWRALLHPQPEDMPCRGDKGPT
jgi:hypothetical protein